MNYSKGICSNISLTKEMPRITRKAKTRCFFGHEFAQTYDDCCNWMSCIAHSCSSPELKELLSELSRKFRGVSCPELSFINHDVATSHGCHIGYSKLNDVPI